MLRPGLFSRMVSSSIGAARFMSTTSFARPSSGMIFPGFKLFQTVKPSLISSQVNTNWDWDTPNPISEEDNTMYMDSVMRKRRLKMKKHKLRKRRRAQRALMKRLGK
ncbi:hypothetical protein CANTEDRAFT_114924 [Yamadazyma tenuis ATCC 10573]|uniref:Small ribosomal subunit protein mS38 n=1 Tax=Candida tenuis (strain ATCC 10573 / BCRC 21748 / CBS 615 / JCM 9827 / NBRC 10315 / NRRL Y-1498 / VKM Y-70) TaxID=590646 RepID=G3BAV1_CANTC|nr:uncharacterized protein CANTEDRAFT_114924 [Yamadazyma tenuis ATCC 10573]EGV61460.1 hypothetical protein CANTEDRAFT_114924 [Yamadazyma tenuis ATCC 10573]